MNKYTDEYVEKLRERKIHMETIVIKAWRSCPTFKSWLEEEFPEDFDTLDRIGA